jgi:glycosyltransferase involved in cell wall biosynthesis
LGFLQRRVRSECPVGRNPILSQAMKVWVFTICFNEAEILPWWLRHYETFAERIIVYDEQSTDGTREILKAHPKVEVREWPHKGLDDVQFVHCINSAYHEAAGKADWVMWPDADELLYSPNIEHVLKSAKEDMILSRGYALISNNFTHVEPHVWNQLQLYQVVKSGYPQSNYDKYICWRPHVQVTHNIGRHTDAGYPHCSGQLGIIPKLKLFHCHHVWGVEHTIKVNARNLDRAVVKQFAWNYSPAHNKPEQVGTEAWVKYLIENNLLFDVVE